MEFLLQNKEENYEWTFINIAVLSLYILTAARKTLVWHVSPFLSVLLFSVLHSPFHVIFSVLTWYVNLLFPDLVHGDSFRGLGYVHYGRVSFLGFISGFHPQTRSAQNQRRGGGDLEVGLLTFWCKSSHASLAVCASCSHVLLYL